MKTSLPEPEVKKMEKKLLVILVSILTIASTMILIIPEYIQVKAADGLGALGDKNSIGINTTFIHSVTQELSNISFTYSRGRSFGTDGEHDARDLIGGWMISDCTTLIQMK
jgi:hypothetical protein